MGPKKSLDEYKLIATLLQDVQTSHGDVFSTRALKLTLQKVNERIRHERIGFLTKTLPRLGKAFDKAISGSTPLNSAEWGFKPLPGSKLPRFLGEFFTRVLSQDGTLLSCPCESSVAVIRLICSVLYKYELPFTDEQEQNVITKFKRTEEDISTSISKRSITASVADSDSPDSLRLRSETTESQETIVTRGAQDLLKRLFATFDPKDIYPRHGPGAVATKQRLWNKFNWKNVSAKITEQYPLDEYFYASLSHVCDRYQEIQSLSQDDLPARVILVPKDSRGPRLISCEPVDYQWIQQGLGRAIVELVETHWLTKHNVHFTDQGPNRRGALLGSSTGKYATLDLNEASDRVSLDLVRLLFPEGLMPFLEACRSSSTVLPDGEVLKLKKFAPMGSCLCFPILALTVWAILTAAAPDQATREGILVYGDDVVVPTAYAEHAMYWLEYYGLKINRDKSCTGGLFRESCGMDAFNGVDVTPVRIRTVWSSSRSPSVYTSWISYANSFYDRRCFATYEYIVQNLHQVYGAIPSDEQIPDGEAPSLREVSDDWLPNKYRTNAPLQKREVKVWVVMVPSIDFSLDGWQTLLRYFTERCGRPHESIDNSLGSHVYEVPSKFSASSYTRRNTSLLVKRWR